MSTQRPTEQTRTITYDYTTNAFGDRYLRALNHASFATHSATESYQRRFGDDLWEPETLYIILGTDSGLLPAYIIEHGLPQGSRYLFIELDEVLPHLSPTIPDELASRLLIRPYSQWRTAIGEADLNRYTYAGKVNLLRASAAQAEHYDGYLPLTQEIEAEVRQLVWKFSSQFDLHIHTKTQLANLAENCFPAACLRNSFTGKSACLLGAGPSLDELIPWIEAHRDELALICVSRVAGLLHKRGITPDIIVTADPQKLSYTVSKEMLKFGDRTLLVNTDSASPHLVGQWYGPSLYLKSEYPWQPAGENGNIGVASPTVTNTALNLILEMGFSEVILAGVDLCYSQEGHSHASGSIEREHGPLSTHIDLTIETNSGREAETNRGYYAAIEAFAKQAQQAARQQCRIINPAPHAARIAQIEHIPVAALRVGHPLPQSAWQTLTGILPETTPTSRRQCYRRKLAELDTTLAKLRKMRRLASAARLHNDRLLNDDGQSLSAKHKRKLDQIESRLNRHYAALDQLTKLFNGREFASAFSSKPVEERTITDAIEQGRAYYQAYLKGVDGLIEQLNHCKLRVENRLEEEQERPDFNKLFDYWSRHDEGARAIVWQKRHPEQFAALDQALKDRFEMMISRYEEGARKDDEQYRAFGRSEEAFHLIMGQVIDKAIDHFHHKEREGLARILSGLTQRPEPQTAEIALLVSGFIHEIEGEIDAALACYRKQNGDTLWTTKQFGLERSLELQMNREDLDAALESLQQLSQREESYTPLHAQLLEITGAIGEAGDLHAQQMQNHPDDIDIAAEYGHFLLRHSAVEGAQIVLKHMERIAPQHEQTERLRHSFNSKII